MAPEYAMRGRLTTKADVYSFGVVALETVSGKSNTNYMPKEDCLYLLDWVLLKTLLCFFDSSLLLSTNQNRTVLYPFHHIILHVLNRGSLLYSGLLFTQKRYCAGAR